MEKNTQHTTMVESFYTCFQQGDYQGMAACYHDQIRFSDPVFGELKGASAGKMWEMLLTKNKLPMQITFKNVIADNEKGSADWEAIYYFGKSQKKVINHVHARFEFSDGKIIAHQDDFDLWKWSRQALGWKGSLLGWTSWMKKQLRKQSLSVLKAFEG